MGGIVSRMVTPVPPRAAGLNGAVVRQIKAERAAAGLSLAELANRAGMAERVLSRYLNFERDLKLETVERLASALDVDLDVLIRRAAERKE